MKVIVQLLILCLLSNVLWSNTTPLPTRYSFHEIPKTLLENSDAVIRAYDKKFEVNSKEKAVFRVHLAVTILNNKTDWNDLVLYYDKFRKIKKINGVVYDARGRVIRKIKKKEIMDLSAVSNGSLHEDGRLKVIAVSERNYPYTVVFDYTVRIKGILSYPDWNIIPSGQTAVQSSSYELTINKNLKVRTKNINTEIIPREQTDGNNNIYRWEAANLNAIKLDGYSFGYHHAFPQVLIQPTQFAIGGHEGDMSSWESLGRFFYELNKGRDNLPDQVVAEVKKLTKNAATNEEKVDILYRYLQNNSRYVSLQLGIGGWQTFDATYVYKNKYGDCKALTNYMKAILKVAGIPSHTALIYAGKKIRPLELDFSSASFNHVILFVPNETDGIWLECTSGYAPTNYLSNFTENRHALLVTPKGGKLVKTPKTTYKNHRKINRAKVILSPKGSATAKIINANHEDEHNVWRHFYHEKSEKEQMKKLHASIDLPSFEISEMTIDLYKNEPRADIKYDLNISKYASRAGKRIFMYPNLLNKKTFIPAEDRTGVNRIVQQSGYTHIDTIGYELPKDFSVENIPHKEFSLETDFGKYKMQVIVKNNRMIYIRHLEIYAFDMPYERYKDLRAFYSKIVKIDGMKVVLIKVSA